MADPAFDLFLAHNSNDKEQIRAVCHALRSRGLNPWFDEERILAGTPFQQVIQEAVPCVRAAAVFVGRTGMGTWQKEEVQVLLDLCKQGNKPIFLVLLPGVDESQIPNELLFIKQRHWVSFQNGVHRAIHDIESTIRGSDSQAYYDVLLCFSDEDLPEVRSVEAKLRQCQVASWHDGLNASALQLATLRDLDGSLGRIATMAVFVGVGASPWEQEIIADLIIEFRELHRPVIPVILKGVNAQEPKLPVYLRRLGRVDFRRPDPPPLDQLLRGIAVQNVWVDLFKPKPDSELA